MMVRHAVPGTDYTLEIRSCKVGRDSVEMFTVELHDAEYSNVDGSWYLATAEEARTVANTAYVTLREGKPVALSLYGVREEAIHGDGTCTRCAGSMVFPTYMHIEAGKCFRCHGTGREPGSK